MLYKSSSGPGFNIVSDEFMFIEENLSFVRLENVEFKIFDDKKDPMIATGRRTVHAFACGILKAALPRLILPKPDLIKEIETLPEIDYNPNVANQPFFLKGTKSEISFAKELFAFNQKVRVKV